MTRYELLMKLAESFGSNDVRYTDEVKIRIVKRGEGMEVIEFCEVPITFSGLWKGKPTLNIEWEDIMGAKIIKE